MQYRRDLSRRYASRVECDRIVHRGLCCRNIGFAQGFSLLGVLREQPSLYQPIRKLLSDIRKG